MIREFCFWAELAGAVGLIIGSLLACLYYATPFVEARAHKATKFAARVCVIILLLSLLLIPAGYDTTSFLPTFVTHCLWLSVLMRGFRSISILSGDLLVAAVGTVISQGCWLSAFLADAVGGFTSLAFTWAFVWGIPIMVVVALGVKSRESEGTRGARKPIWDDLLAMLIAFTGSFVPGGAHRFQ
jgi:hypothetical protein